MKFTTQQQLDQFDTRGAKIETLHEAKKQNNKKG